jgi:hypothetical protein
MPYNLSSLLKMPCPLCGKMIEPILGATIRKDGPIYIMGCLTCAPPQKKEGPIGR